CLGVKRKEPGANWRSLPGDCSHLGRQTENETVPVTPEIFLNAGSVFLDPAPHRLAKVRCVWLKSSHGVRLHLRFGRRNRGIVSTTGQRVRKTAQLRSVWLC